MRDELKQSCSIGTETTNKMGTFEETHPSVKAELEKNSPLANRAQEKV